MDSTRQLGPVLVAGGCGFLGHHIVNQVRMDWGEEVEIVVIDTVVTRNIVPSVIYHTVDVTKLEDVMKVMSAVKPQVVFDTVSPRFDSSHPMLQKVNVQGTQNLIDCAKTVGTVKAFIFTASSSVIHNQRNPLIEATEDLPVLFSPQQPEFYSHTKALAERSVLLANRQQGMLTASFRPALLYGEGDNVTTTNLTRQAVTGKTRFVIGDGKPIFDTCYVENCAFAQVLAAQTLIKASSAPPLPEKKRVEGEAFFVTDDQHVPFWGFRRMIAEVAGCPVKEEEVKYLPRWLMMAWAWLTEWGYWIFTLGTKQSTIPVFAVRITTMDRTICIDKIKERLGYKPKFTMAEGLAKAISWRLTTMDKNGHIKETA